VADAASVGYVTTGGESHDMQNTPLDRDVIGKFIDCAVQDRRQALEMLQAYPELRDARWLHEETILHFLAVEGFRDAVEWLASVGFDVNATNRFGEPAIIDAVVLGNVDMARTLISHGADVNAVCRTRGNALHCAVEVGDVPMVELLLQAGAKVDYAAPYGRTCGVALGFCPAEHRSQITELLRKAIRG
jgi:hypothetical protein